MLRELKEKKISYRTRTYVFVLLFIILFSLVCMIYAIVSGRAEAKKTAQQNLSYRVVRLSGQIDEMIRITDSYDSGFMSSINPGTREDRSLEKWENWIKRYLETGENLVVLDGDGQLIYSTNDDFDRWSMFNYTYHHIQVKEASIDGYKHLNAAQSYSYLLGWTYILFSEGNYKPSFGQPITWIGLAVIVVVAGALLFITAYSAFRPIDLLVHDIAGNDTDEIENGIEYIKHQMMNLSDNKEALEKVVRSQEVHIQEMFQLRLVNEGIKSEDEWDEYFNGFNLPDYKYFATAVLVLDVRYNFKAQDQLKEDAICLQMLESMPEEAKKLLWMPAVYNSCTIFSLFGANTEEQLLENINSFYIKMQEYSKKLSGFPIIMGISSTYDDHRRIRRAYRESIKALMSQQKTENTDAKIEERVGTELFNKSGESVVEDSNCRFFIDMLPSAPVEAYSSKWENDIQLAIKEADKQKAYKLTDRFAEMLLTVPQTDMQVLYITRYADKIVMTGMESNVPISDIFPNSMRHTYQELLTNIEARRVRKYIKEFFIDPIINNMNNRMQNDSFKIMESIDALLAETKGNILLAELADKLNLNQNYIWKVLKMERGLTFTEYAEKYKIDEAKRLLLETDMPVQEIAAKLDYANPQNFIRFFSKATGITPGKFRKMF